MPKNDNLNYLVLVSTALLLVWTFLSSTPLVDLGVAANSALLTYHAISMICLLAGMVAISGKNLLLIISFVLYSFLNTLLMFAQVIYFLGILRLSPKPDCNDECFRNMMLILRFELILGFTLSLLNSLFLSAYVICGCYEEDPYDIETSRSYFSSLDPWIEEPLPAYIPKEKEPPVYEDLPLSSSRDQI